MVTSYAKPDALVAAQRARVVTVLDGGKAAVVSPPASLTKAALPALAHDCDGASVSSTTPIAEAQDLLDAIQEVAGIVLDDGSARAGRPGAEERVVRRGGPGRGRCWGGTRVRGAGTFVRFLALEFAITQPADAEVARVHRARVPDDLKSLAKIAADIERP